MPSKFSFANHAIVGFFLAAGVWLCPDVSQAVENDPDLPRFVRPVNRDMVKEEFMARRAEGAAFKRGLHGDKRVDPRDRQTAIQQMQQQQRQLAAMPASALQVAMNAAWTEIGPSPIPNAQVVVGPSTAASGRTIAIAVHPTNPNLVYVGTAQGGLYRSTNGGASWTAMMDNALSLAVETIAIVPSQPDTIFVGTGESGFAQDSFFGVGIYRIDNASTVSPVITGPIGAAEFTGRSISKIVVHPTDGNTIFVSSAVGIGGIGAASNSVLSTNGVFRSTNALGATPTFTKLTVAGLVSQDRPFIDMVMDPGNPDLLLVASVDRFGEGTGGVYRSTNALAAAPTFVRTFAAGTTTNTSRTELALHRSAGGVVTVYAASGFNGGTVQRSVDGGATWTQTIDNNFCTPQCFYDIAIAVDPTNAATVYLGGSPALVFGRSTDSGATFTANAATANGLHGDSHVIAVAPSLPSTIYFGSDGGIYKSTDSGTTWTSLNNTTFKATQFMSIAVHPVDPNFTIGGTQDNGTNFYRPDATWLRVDGGDGGYALIDQSSTNSTMVNMYHTYFNNGTLQGYAYAPSVAAAVGGSWAFRGCSTVAGNGIPCGGAVLFYAPLEQGPGSPNTLYFGANILYRSSDTGLTHTAVSQNLTTAISAIGISQQSDNVRIVGQANGGLFGTTTGSTTLTNLDTANAVPDNFVARAVIDPNNANTAYVTLSAFGVANVWRTTNLSNANPTWTAITGTGPNVLPQVPVSAFLVDPANSTILYAGTDIGVYASTDSGANWMPFGTGLPRVAVFDMAKTSFGLIRIATHGRGMWQAPAIGWVPAPYLLPGTSSLVSESFLPANGVIDPGETVTVSLAVVNVGSGDSINDIGTLQATGGVTGPSAAQNYGVVVAAGAAVSRNFTFTAAPSLTCGASINATVAHVDGATNLGTTAYKLGGGGLPGASTTTSYTGPPVAIPDNASAGVNIILPVSGVVGAISDLNFRFDALAGCDNVTGNTNASVTHTFMSDLVFKLTSPAGTSVYIVSNRGDDGKNFCTILLDDDGGFAPISSLPATGGATGSFAPESPLSAFDGENANGNWTLNVADLGPADTGWLNRFSLIIIGSTCATGPLPDLTVNKAHSGNFAQGQIGARYAVTVSNVGTGVKPASTTVSVTDAPPAGLSITAMSGTGWTCTTLPTCTRNDTLAAGSSYPVINVTVSVAANATTPLSNSASVTTTATESNTGNNMATDSTIIVAGVAGSLTVAKVGSGSGAVTSLDGGINCGATCTASYVNSSNIVLTAVPVVGSVFTGWLGACSGAGNCVATVAGASSVTATFALAPVSARVLDVDANNGYDGATDGVLILRYLFGLTGTALTTNALGAGFNPTRVADPALRNYLLDVLPYLDVDGNGKVDAMTDGLMIMRKLLGQTGPAVTANAIGPGATRSAVNIEPYIQTLKPP